MTRISLEGKAARDISPNVWELLAPADSKGFEIFFVTYSNHEIATGHVFHKIYEENNPSNALSGNFELKQVTFQLARLLDVIPQGYKTICLFKLMPEESNIYDSITTVRAWGESEKRFCME